MRILFMNKRPLFPPTTGGHLRTLHILKHLARWHDITYLCNVQAHEGNALSAMEALGLRVVAIPWYETPRHTLRFYGDLARNLFSMYPFNVNKDYDPRLRARAAELLHGQPFDLLICDFVQMARNVLGLKAPAKLLFQHNVEAQIFQRHAEQDSGWLRRWYMGHQARKMRRFESAAGQYFDGVIAVSQADKDRFLADYGWQHVQVIDTAVDTDYFQPVPQPSEAHRVVFVGSLDWLPNADGIRFFVDRIWPRILEQVPQAHFQVVGRNPAPALLRLQQRPGVEIVGTVPDVRPYLAQAAVVVVPLLVGGGTRMKIFEAMAMRRAVVSTPLGAEGLPVRHAEHILLADTPQQFAEQVLRLLTQPELRQQLAERAYQYVTQNFASEIVARQFDAICTQVVETARARRKLAVAPV